MMLETCTLAVLALMNSWVPIWRLLRPSATSARISASRAVSDSPWREAAFGCRPGSPAQPDLGPQRLGPQPLGHLEGGLELVGPARVAGGLEEGPQPGPRPGRLVGVAVGLERLDGLPPTPRRAGRGRHRPRRATGAAAPPRRRGPARPSTRGRRCPVARSPAPRPGVADSASASPRASSAGRSALGTRWMWLASWPSRRASSRSWPWKSGYQTRVSTSTTSSCTAMAAGRGRRRGRAGRSPRCRRAAGTRPSLSHHGAGQLVAGHGGVVALRGGDVHPRPQQERAGRLGRHLVGDVEDVERLGPATALVGGDPGQQTAVERVGRPRTPRSPGPLDPAAVDVDGLVEPAGAVVQPAEVVVGPDLGRVARRPRLGDDPLEGAAGGLGVAGPLEDAGLDDPHLVGHVVQARRPGPRPRSPRPPRGPRRRVPGRPAPGPWRRAAAPGSAGGRRRRRRAARAPPWWRPGCRGCSR